MKHMDVCAARDWQAIRSEVIERFGTLHVLCLNAGIGVLGKVLQARPHDRARERRYPVLDTELGVAVGFVMVDFHPIPGSPRPDAGSFYMMGVFKVVDGELRVVDEIREILPLGALSGWQSDTFS
jgi:NAD(P)-dependent dehydrogenase (short-subunit alcohol dehydrogenase family)